LFGFHVAVLLYGNALAYRLRHADTKLSESRFVSMALVSHLQLLLVGIPLLVLVYNDTKVNYLVRSSIIFFNDFTVIVLIFLPKALELHFQVGWHTQEVVLTTRYSIGTSSKNASATKEARASGNLSSGNLSSA